MKSDSARTRRGLLDRPLLLLLGLGMAVALLIGRDYGMSVDEVRNASVGQAALSAYTGSPTYFWQPSLGDHGPAYFMLYSTASELIHQALPGWSVPDGRHLTNFLMFLLAIASLYSLALRFVSKRAAWITAALFATQPLLFGQAFINQKDIPFLALVLLSLAAGLAAADRLQRPVLKVPQENAGVDTSSGWSTLAAEFRGLSQARKLLAVLILTATGLIVLDMIATGVLKGIAESLIAAAYAGEAPAPVQAMFDQVATDAYKTPLALYLEKFAVAWFAFRWVVPVFFIGLSWLALSRIFPRAALAWGCSPRQILPLDWNWALLGSAVLLGLAICVRQLGAYYGLLISAYALYRGRARALAPLFLYWGIALAVTTATWPYLWSNPVARFVDSLNLSANFPDTHVTFFQGEWLRAGTYPWHYFPNLAAVELTEPTVVLILAGLVVAGRRLLRRPDLTPQILLLGAWIGGPLLALIAFNLTTYGNITHLLFVLPAFFILAGMALELLLDRVGKAWLRLGLVALCLLPGVWGIVRLHPYEFIYFNSFTGGVSGAAEVFEMDRWCISIREAMERVNELAPSQATVMLPSSTVQAEPFARPDLQLVDNRASYDEADFVIDCAWIHTVEPVPQVDFEVVGEVRRGEAVLTTIWQRALAQ